MSDSLPQRHEESQTRVSPRCTWSKEIRLCTWCISGTQTLGIGQHFQGSPFPREGPETSSAPFGCGPSLVHDEPRLFLHGRGRLQWGSRLHSNLLLPPLKLAVGKCHLRFLFLSSLVVVFESPSCAEKRGRFRKMTSEGGTNFSRVKRNNRDEPYVHSYCQGLVRAACCVCTSE